MINNLPTIGEKNGAGQLEKIKPALPAACCMLHAVRLLYVSLDNMIVAIYGVVINSAEAGSCFLSLSHSVSIYQQYMLIYYQ